MLQYIKGDILQEQVFVVPVNTVGAMGKGLALDTAKKFPLAEQSYRSAFRLHLLRIGKVLPVHLSGHTLFFLPTKKHWGNPSTLAYVEKGLRGLIDALISDSSYDPSCVAIPKLGCGLGGLDWQKVKPLIEKTAQSLELYGIDVKVYI
jgi:O-acetyl-ADP-ribose deacetylase (regulator of RNase III)